MSKVKRYKIEVPFNCLTEDLEYYTNKFGVRISKKPVTSTGCLFIGDLYQLRNLLSQVFNTVEGSFIHSKFKEVAYEETK